VEVLLTKLSFIKAMLQ